MGLLRAPYTSIPGCSRDTPPHILCPLGFGPEASGRRVRGGPEKNVRTGPHTCQRVGEGGGDRRPGGWLCVSAQPCLGLMRDRNEGAGLADGTGYDSWHLPPPSRESHPCCPFCVLPRFLALDLGISALGTDPLTPLFSYSSTLIISPPPLGPSLSGFPPPHLALFSSFLSLPPLPFFPPFLLPSFLPSTPTTPSYFLWVLWAFLRPSSVPIRRPFCFPQAVRSHTRTECKCHGLSGSCALRTCWQKLPPFREVGARLLERFHGASRVMGTNDGKALLPAVRTLKPPGRADLLYAADSPDFCAPNRRTGSPGTRGRACNSSAPDLSGCDLLCCGRGHRQESVQLEENCLCRFHWCCVVQCHRCRVRKELSLCL